MQIEIKKELVKKFEDLKVERGDGSPVDLGDYVNGVLFNDLAMVKEILDNNPGRKDKSPGKAGGLDDLPY